MEITPGKPLTALCNRCAKEISEREMLTFGGTVACEDCVRQQYPSPPYAQGYADKEVEVRRYDAKEYVRVNRQLLAKQQEAREAQRDWRRQ